ncbi:MAG: hypothetical protein M1830_001010 [Pleopsidium flavum]|nr:MAG: hypothetical protein M1830_001010 [Pleopsidium flavum]
MALSTEQLKAIEVTERIASILSLLGTSYIIVTFITAPAFRKPINRLVFYASWGNIICNVATLISRSGIDAGIGSALCQFQGFLIQVFMPADALWTLAMACNVYLTFFHKFNACQLRRLEWKYFVACYGLPMIPAITYLCIDNSSRGKIYGPATLWCWISIEWDFLRVAVFYGPVWLVIVVTFTIYARAGKEIFKKRQQLRNVSQTPPFTVIENPFISCKTTEVHISNEPAGLVRNDSQTSLCDDHGNRMQGYNPYTVTVEIGSGSSETTPPRTSGSRRAFHGSNAANEANSAAWGYTKCAMLFFISLIVTWVPSTVNRVYSLVHPEEVNFPLNYASGLVLPLQGFWNAFVYIITSLPASKALYRSLRHRQRPPFVPRNSSIGTTQSILPGRGSNVFMNSMGRLAKN